MKMQASDRPLVHYFISFFFQILGVLSLNNKTYSAFHFRNTWWMSGVWRKPNNTIRLQFDNVVCGGQSCSPSS